MQHIVIIIWQIVAFSDQKLPFLSLPYVFYFIFVLITLSGPNLFCLVHPYSNLNLGFLLLPFILFPSFVLPPSLPNEVGIKSGLRLVQMLVYKDIDGNRMPGNHDSMGTQPLRNRQLVGAKIARLLIQYCLTGQIIRSSRI